MISINGGFQLLQLSSNHYWPLGQLSSHPLTVSQSVTDSLVSSHSQHNLNNLHDSFSDCSSEINKFRNFQSLVIPC